MRHVPAGQRLARLLVLLHQQRQWTREVVRTRRLGALWNGQDAPPRTNDDGQNNVRVIRSRSGHEVRLSSAWQPSTLDADLDWAEAASGKIAISAAANSLPCI